jgi:riboflavin kinase/FMN adenylyltransferase
LRIVSLEQAQSGIGRLAIGTFDGVHLGHRDVIAQADSVLTFEPHPVSVLRPAHTPRILTPLPIKAALIESLGPSELIVIAFDAAFAARSASEFVEDVIVGRLQARSVSVGENFRFGHGARGDAAMLAADGRFQTRVVPLRELDGEVVSSSHIRSLIAAGEVGRATRMLGAPFELRGTVVSGDRRGRELGFPTANLVPDERLAKPGHGVYACLASSGERSFAAAVNVGVRPTFESGRGELIEAHLLDFDGDLYGSELRLHFLERLRGERRFDSVEALIAAMHEDVARAREICASASLGG